MVRAGVGRESETRTRDETCVESRDVLEETSLCFLVSRLARRTECDRARGGVPGALGVRIIRKHRRGGTEINTGTKPDAQPCWCAELLDEGTT